MMKNLNTRNVALLLAAAAVSTLAGHANARGGYEVTVVYPHGVAVTPSAPAYYPYAGNIPLPAYLPPPMDQSGYTAPLYQQPAYSNAPPIEVIEVPRVHVYRSEYPLTSYPQRVPRSYYADERRFDDNAPWERRDQAQRRYMREERQDERERGRDALPGYRR